MSVPLGALVSKSRRMTLSSWSSVSTVEKSSSGMTFGGNTMRPCRFRTNAFMSVLSDPQDGSGSAPRGALHPPLDGGDEPRAQLGGRHDRVHRPHPLGAPDVVDRLELRGHL